MTQRLVDRIPRRMKKVLAGSSLLALIFAAAACGSGAHSNNCNAKDQPEKGFCFEYAKGMAEEGQKVCGDFKAKWSEGPCDRADALGDCKMKDITKVFYSTGKLSAAEAAKECGGDWKPAR